MRTVSTIAVIAAVVLMLGYTPQQASAKGDIDKREQKAAMAEAEGLLKRDKEAVEEVVTAIERLYGMLDHDMALALLKYFDECDRAWDSASGDKNAPKDAKGRPKQAYKIANAILECIRRMGQPEEVAEFEKDINDRDEYSLRPRMAMIDALAANTEDEACLKVLVDLAKNEKGKMDTDMRVLAIQHLGKHAKVDDVFHALMKCLNDGSWRVREATAIALIDADGPNEDQIIVALINDLAKETGKMRKSIADALKKITGVDNGTDPDKWIDWFTNKKREDQGLPPKSGKGDRGTRVKVFETETFSDRYVFLIDTSVSMTEKITEEEKERLKKSITSGPGDDKDPRRPLDWSQINCKLDLAREEMIRSLEVMDPERTTFTVISFAENATIWKDELVPTDEDNVAEVADWLRKIKGQKRTNVFGALDAAYDLSERIAGTEVDKRKEKKKKKKDDKDGPVTGMHRDDALPDTIFLYTDGYATWGKYSGEDVLWAGKSNDEKARLYAPIMKLMIDEVEDRNRIARITLNCVGVGQRQDSTTLSALAKSCGGKYVAIGK
ncbi:MAG: hypothetical protein KDB90_10755 [Planctomycetes bacterium]|nr:hypothetical protein [Planctomycetota bacterium]